MEKTIYISGKKYTESELWALRRYIERWKCEEEAGEIVNTIAEDEVDSDPNFAVWIDENKESMTEHIADMIEQRNFMSCYEVCYDPYAETLRQYYERALAEAKN